MVRERYKLSLGTLQIDNLTQRRINIIGAPGTGKTTTLKMMALGSPIPIYIFDPLDAIKYIEGFDKIRVDKKGVGRGKEFGLMLNKKEFQPKGKNGKTGGGLIISFMDLLQEQEAAFAEDLFSVWRPSHCMIGIDEIHEFCPERGMGMEYSSEVERAVRHWRNSDVGFVMTSQRPAFVSKRVLGLTDYLILYRLTWGNDVQTVSKDLLSQINASEAKIVMQGIQTKGFLEGYTVDFRYGEHDVT